MDKIVTITNKKLSGEIEIPSDKSISHRAIMLSSMTQNAKIKIHNFSKGADCLSTLNLYKNLGVEINYLDEKTIELKTCKELLAPSAELNCGNSGTTMRLSSGILVGQKFNSVLVGDESLSKRPMSRIIKPLTLMGAEIISENNSAPLNIIGDKKLNGIEYFSDLASAQVKSCVLLAGLNAIGETSFTEPYLSRNHTENMLKHFGVSISTQKTDKGHKTSISKSEFHPKDLHICGDISSATYFIIAALIVPNSKVIIKNVGLNPTRSGIIDIVKRMGGNIEILDQKLVCEELVGDIKVCHSELNSCTIEKEDIPRLIDELPAIAVLATQANGQTIIKDAQDLRNKETDRISNTVNELKKLGANIQETHDGFIINGKTNLIGNVEVNSYQDHRLAMSLYIAGLICKKEILIKNFEWVNISFPEFESLITKLIIN